MSAPLVFDRPLVRRRLARALKSGYADFLLRRAIDDLEERLGSVLRPIYVKARVVRLAKKQMYLVGCRFTGRLQPPQANSSRTRTHAAQATLSVH